MVRRFWSLPAAVFCLVAVGPGAAAMPSSEMLSLASQSTFEVVLPKVEPAWVKYEKPLPVELLSFTERNDKYWSIGTAFALGPDTYVSAAHVLRSGLGSGMGRPALRNANGEVFPVERVLKHSTQEDYIVFSVKGAPQSKPIPTNSSPTMGAPVFAVGNALGDGVVIRDGLLTSRSAEDQEGRWKWLRFSAAASPGNSGGPLLDADGKVLGVIVAKSENENLNYALPIEQVIKGSSAASVTDVRASFGLPILRAESVVTHAGSFPLPTDWQDFEASLLREDLRHYSQAQDELLKQQAGSLFPKGSAARLSATLDKDVMYALVRQKDDDSWGFNDSGGEDETDLPNEGKLWSMSVQDIALFRLRRDPADAAPGFHADGAQMMDLLLRALKLPRQVGSQSVRITSLGKPQVEKLFHDRFGRVWYERTWDVGFSDTQIITMSLPTPEGLAGLARFSTADAAEPSRVRLRLMADYFHLTYSGSLRQWRDLLASGKIVPPLLRDLKLEVGEPGGVSLKLPNLHVRVPREVVKTDDETLLKLYMAFVPGKAGLQWIPMGMAVSGTAVERSFVEVLGQPKPSAEAGSKLNERWTKLLARKGEYAGDPQHSARFDEFWTRSVVGNAEQGRLFEVVMSLKEETLLPRDVTAKRDQLLSGVVPIEGGP